MKKLDDILLEDIKSFDILDKKLIIYTKDEKLEYTYPTNLELLRKISYFIHRYRIEINNKIIDNIKKIDEKKQNIKINIIEIFNIFFNNFIKSTLMLFFIVTIFGLNTIIKNIYLAFGIYNFMYLYINMSSAISTFSKKNNFEKKDIADLENLQLVFESIKIKSLNFITILDEKLLNHINDNTKPDKSFIENMYIAERNITDFLEEVPYVYEEKQSQKSLGEYPH